MSKPPEVPNTITDRQYADLSRRAVAANPQMFTVAAIRQRKASAEQQRKAGQS
ncbi:hypothetical protein [Micromonospora rubida]|uniref:hypothetical protein n=1 Tax=Micromonospora rubida TaxID=2697657 RepID=UPI00191C1C6D|nr:hypothetical protein [Micromonospora rubida]